MGREATLKPNYQILAYLTTEKTRVLSSNCLALFTNSEDALKGLTADIAKAMKADVVKLSNGDYMIIKI